MPNNVIDVCYSESIRSKTRHAYQYDYGQKLAFSGFDLPDAFEVHFATDTGSITQIGTDNQVTIPDACFTAAKSVSAWLYLHEGETDGETRYEIEIPVRPRAAITREEPTPVQQDAIDQAIAALQSAVEKTGEAQQAAEDAAESVKNAGATAETLSPGSPATVVVRDVEGVKTFEFGIPEGRKGETGETPNFTVGSVTTLPAGSPVTVTITGTDENPVLNIGIPQGAQGDKGDTGAVPHFTIGTVTTLPPNSPATVTVTGTDENPILNLGIPKGIQGQKGDKGDAFTYADFTEEQKAELIQGPIQTAQSAAVAAVQNAGAAQVQSVESKGQEVRDSIPSDYSALSDDVNSLKSAFTEHEEYAEDTYAKQDGYYQDMAVGTAEQLVSSKFVEDQEPYTLRPAGGSADIGNRENLRAVVGGTLAWNQQVRDEASDNVTEFADIVTVDDAVADNAGVKVKIEPVQDLHGYDHPWPAGGGKNLIVPIDRSFTNNGVHCVCSASAETVSLKGTATDSGGRTGKMTKDIVLPAGTYMLSIAAASGTRQATYIVNRTDNNAYISTALFSLEEETSVYVGANVSNGTVYDEVVHIQIEAGSTATAWTPYSNICPISGWDAVKITRSGANLLPTYTNSVTQNGITYTANADGSVTVNGTATATNTYTAPFGTYVWDGAQDVWLSGCPAGGNYGNGYSLRVDGQNATWSNPDTGNGVKLADYSNAASFIGRSIKFCIVIRNGTVCNNLVFKPMLNFGNSALPYEQYKGMQTYSITLPSEAGTVYGGELTVNEDGTGTLVVDRGETDLGDYNYSIVTLQGKQAFRSATSISGIKGHSTASSITHSICERYLENSEGIENGQFFIGATIYSYSNKITIRDDAYSDATAFKTAVTGTKLVYPLATPIIYTLTASQVQTLLGTNNVWADAGQLSLTYKGTDEHLTLTDGRKYLTRINGADSMVLGAGQAVTAVKGRDNVFDLTQMFGTADVADYVYGQGAGYFRKWFPNGLYAYNPGELKSVEGLQSHDTVGFNLFNGIWEKGYINPSTGAFVPNNAYATTDYIPVIAGLTYYCKATVKNNDTPNTELYDAEKNYLGRTTGAYIGRYNSTFSVRNGVCYIRLTITYMNVSDDSFCISLAHNNSRNGEYEPYEKHSYPLDSSLTLRGIPKVGSNGIYWDGDQYKPDGTVERRYGVVDLGSLTWTYDSTYNRFNTMVAPAKTAGNARVAPIACAKYAPIRDGRSIANVPDKSIYRGTDHDLSVHDSAYTDAAAFKAAMSGVLLVYELATPTTETAEPYKELQQVDDWGTEEFVSTGLIPVGHVTKYPANLRDKLQHLPDLASSNGIYIVKQTDSEMELMRLPDMPAENGNYRLKLNVASGSPTFSWEVVT